MGGPDTKDDRHPAMLRHGQAGQKSKETPKPTSAPVPDPGRFRKTQNGRLKRRNQEKKRKKLKKAEKKAEKEEENLKDDEENKNCEDADHSSSHGYSSDAVSSDIYTDNLGHRHPIQESSETDEPELNAVMALASDAAQPTSRDSVTLTTTTKDDTTEVITITELPADPDDANPSNETSAEENRRNHPELVVETNAGQEEESMRPPRQQLEKIAYHHKLPGWTFHQPSPAWWADRYAQAGWTYYQPLPIWSHYNPSLDQISYYYPSPHLCVHNPSQTWYYYNQAMGWTWCDHAQAWRLLHPEPYELLHCIGPGHPPDWTHYRYIECPTFLL